VTPSQSRNSSRNTTDIRDGSDRDERTSGSVPTPIRVLHVDDSLDFANTVAQLLEHEDAAFEVTPVTSAGDALDQLNDEFDCIVSDYDMPEMDGIKFLDAVRDKNEEIPFILFTGKGSEEIASQAIAHGVTDYLQKETGASQYTVLANRIRNAVEQYHAVQRAANLDRIRRVLRDGNQALVRAETRDEIEQQICDIISDADPYLFAWIGEQNPDKQTVESRTAAGIEDGYLETVEITTRDDATGHGPTGRAIRTHEFAAMQNIPENPEYEPWRDEAVDRGYQSSAAIPLTFDDTVYGVLNVYADRTNAFDDQERELLVELGGDIAHAIYRADAQTQQERYERVIENLPVGVYRARPGPDGEILDANPSLADIFDAESPEDLLKHSASDFYQDPDERTALSRELEERGIVQEMELQQETLEGDHIWISVTAIRTEEEGEVYFDGIIQDITERKEREQKLRERETHLRQAQAIANFGSWQFDITADELTWLDKVYHLFNVPRETPLTFDEFLEFVHPDDRAFVEEQWTAALNGNPYDIEHRIVVNGDTRWVREKAEITFDENDNPQRAIGVVQDVTEQKERERELERSQERLQALLEHSPDAIAIHDADGNIIKTNQQNIENLGYSREELLSMNVAEYEVGHTREELRHAWADMDVGDRLQIEGKHRRKDGSTYPIEVWITKLEFDGEHQFLALGRDITERREYEQTLREERQFIEQALNALDDIFYVINSDWTFERVNERAVKIIGYTEDELLSMKPSEFFAASDVERVESAITEAFETSGATLEAELITKDGEEIPHEFRKRRLTDSEGDVIGVAGIARDISDRKQREQQLQNQNERLEQFASIVSHDLRNPLNVAQGRLDFVRGDCDDEHLDAIDRSLERMETLITNLLALARAGDSITNPESLDLETIVKSCWKNVVTGDATLTINTDSKIQADKTRFQQLLENLFRNAIEHAGENVSVIVGDMDDGFYVADDGPGVPENERDRIFESGYTTRQDGTGLGLSIVEEIVNAHQWELNVTTSENGGARFEFRDVDLNS
jgi:PAS domain S-box-containing protein